MSQSSFALPIQPIVTESRVSDPAVSKKPRRWQVVTGWILTGLVSAFLLFDLAVKLMQVPMAVEGTRQLGYPVSMIFPLGVIQLLMLIAYLVPRTSVLGAILWTGYLGGAVATHVRIGNPLFSHILFPTYVAAVLWGALWLRDRRVRALVPIRSNEA